MTSVAMVGMGFTSRSISEANSDNVWAALVQQARDPSSVMACSNVSISDCAGYMARTMTVTSFTGSTQVSENIYADETRNEMVYRLVRNGAETADERVIAMRMEPLRLEFFYRNTADNCRSFWKAPQSVVTGIVEAVVAAASGMQNGGGSTVGFGMRSQTVTGVTQASLWRVMVEAVREPARFIPCSNVSLTECDGYVQRTMTLGNGQTVTENITENEQAMEIVYRKVNNGVVDAAERVIAVRTHPLQVEFHERTACDGFRCNWAVPRSIVTDAVAAYLKEARRIEGQQPTVIGYGVSSDNISGVSVDDVFAAVTQSIRCPVGFACSNVQVTEMNGYIQRTMTLGFNNENVMEQIRINEEAGEVTYTKCNNGRPGNTVRCLGVRSNPTRVEFYERSANGGMRMNWQAPYSMAMNVVTGLVDSARKISNQNSPNIGMGIASNPLSCSADDAWRAMCTFIREPQRAMPVQNVQIRDCAGFVQRSYTIDNRPGTVTDNIYVMESAREIIFRPVVNGSEGGDERVFALRTGPVRFEMYTRSRGTEMRRDWAAPRSVATRVFSAVQSLAGSAPAASSAAASGAMVGMGYTSGALQGVDFDSIFEALDFMARNPQSFMKVTNVSCTDMTGFLARSMTVTANGRVVRENIYANERAREMVFRLVRDGIETQDERVISVQLNPIRLEFFYRRTNTSTRCMWQAPVSVVQTACDRIVARAQTIMQEAAAGSTVGMGWRSDTISGVSVDSLWRAILTSLREPARFMNATNVSIVEGNGCICRSMTVDGKNTTENIYEYEGAHEVVYRRTTNGQEGPTERVLAVRTHPMQLEFCERNTADGFRVNWTVPKTVVRDTVSKFLGEARRVQGVSPAVIGYGITSDAVQGLNYDDLQAAVAASIRNPERVIDVVAGSCTVTDGSGYLQRSMTLAFNGERVTERITINEEAGETSYNKLRNGALSPFERVLAIRKDPLRMEFFERSARGNMRVNWQAPYDVARNVFTQMVNLAREISSQSGPVIGYGIGSQVLSGVSTNSMWKAMLFCAQSPAQAGMDVSNVSVTDKNGFVQRTYTIPVKGQTVTDNVYIRPASREIIYRPVANGVETSTERVFCARDGPRFEMYSRNVGDELRQNWTTPRAVAMKVFQSCENLARSMEANPAEFQRRMAGASTSIVGYAQ